MTIWSEPLDEALAVQFHVSRLSVAVVTMGNMMNPTARNTIPMPIIRMAPMSMAPRSERRASPFSRRVLPIAVNQFFSFTLFASFLFSFYLWVSISTFKPYKLCPLFYCYFHIVKEPWRVVIPATFLAEQYSRHHQHHRGIDNQRAFEVEIAGHTEAAA